jgi:D-proline reductase (dithiol) PrdB
MPMLRLKNRLFARIFTALPFLAANWGKRLPTDTDTIPWTPASVPLATATVALITTGGTHLRGDAPFNMLDPAGDPTMRRIPVSAAPADITITHDYYDHRDAQRDLNLVLPLDRLQDLVAAGIIGRLHPVAYGLMGHIDQPHITTLQEVTAPRIAAELREGKVDYALLVPA